MNRIAAWVLAAIVGIAVGSGTFVWLSDNPVLAVTLVFVYTVGTRFFVEYASTMPGMIYGDDWQTVRWNGAITAFVMVAAFFGVNTTLPISDGLRFALVMLVFGVGWTGLFFGIAMAREQAAANGSVGEPETVNGIENGDLTDTNTDGT